MLTTGPFTMAPGESQEIVVGIVVGQSVNRIASVAKLVERWGIEFPAIPELDIDGVDVSDISPEDIIPVF